MHQPYYGDHITGQYTLPWVRLHAAKDYVHMAELVREFPDIHLTFNYVPSLVEQLEDYADGRARDVWSELSGKETLSASDKEFMLEHFFSVNQGRAIKPHHRYWQLLQLRDQARDAPDLLSDQYWRDLSVLFNLAWIDPEERERDPELRALSAQGMRFAQRDVELVHEKHREFCRRVVPAHRSLVMNGQIEISTSPYYHPILPLLVNLDDALDASPHLSLPARRFRHPDDAVTQLRAARQKHLETFGFLPRGLWPSEGAVSDTVASLVGADGGWTWMASDEAILARSLGIQLERDGHGHLMNWRDLYQPYYHRNANLAMVFRDRHLSDRIGFVYKHLSARDAAHDLLGRLRWIRDQAARDDKRYLVSIILDGENAWEEYENNGSDFLRYLYGGLSEDRSLRTVTFSEHLSLHPPERRLERVAAGSWIFGNLETWIGEPGQNQAWEYLATVRAYLTGWQTRNSGVDPDVLESAWREIQIAEGSDWFWWYYSRNRFGQEHLFDREFRRHLGNVYRLIGEPVPSWLDRPISISSGEYTRSISGPLTGVSLQANESASPDWDNAGVATPNRSTGAMQQATGTIRRLYYGYDQDTLWLRLEANREIGDYGVRLHLQSQSAGKIDAQPDGIAPPLSTPVRTDDLRGSGSIWEIEFPSDGHDEIRLIVNRPGKGDQVQAEAFGEYAGGRGIAEFKIPLAGLGLAIGDRVKLKVELTSDGNPVDQVPTDEMVAFSLNV
jgi:alpha-amylase/alpha-mannosidase (GH57 family)